MLGIFEQFFSYEKDELVSTIVFLNIWKIEIRFGLVCFWLVVFGFKGWYEFLVEFLFDQDIVLGLQ